MQPGLQPRLPNHPLRNFRQVATLSYFSKPAEFLKSVFTGLLELEAVDTFGLPVSRKSVEEGIWLVERGLVHQVDAHCVSHQIRLLDADGDEIQSIYEVSKVSWTTRVKKWTNEKSTG